MNDIVKEIKEDRDIRKNLISLKNAVREEEQKKALAYNLAGDFSAFTELLDHEDPKVRKNSALILGEMESEDLAPILWKAYEAEETLFIRTDYLKAISNYDCTPYIAKMKERLKELTEKEPLPEEEKHVRSETVMLQSICMRFDKPRRHKFVSYDEFHEIVLMTNRNHREATRSQLMETRVKMLAGGMRLETNRLKDILNIRTYSEMLFPIWGNTPLSGSPERMAHQLLENGMLEFLKNNHDGEPPFYFRLEVKSAMSQDQKIDLVKKLSAAIEAASKREMLNATSGYEVELRLVSSREGRMNPFLKLFTIPDWRFSYRKGVLPTSIAPVNAALIMELSKEYFREDAQILDPFCGVGTMLVERQKIWPAKSVYGIDILEEAIEKARENTELARMKVNYINRDFFDFTHEYLFDEIITNLPVKGKTRNEEAVEELYNRFLDQVPKIAKEGATIMAYTSMHEEFRRCLRNRGEYRLMKEYCFNEREGSFLHILKYLG